MLQMDVDIAFQGSKCTWSLKVESQGPLGCIQSRVHSVSGQPPHPRNYHGDYFGVPGTTPAEILLSTTS